MLRIDVDGGTPYGIPLDNPFVGVSGVAPEIWALGVRDPRHVGFDLMSGELYLADVGESVAHEINVQAPDSRGGEDYGTRWWSTSTTSSSVISATVPTAG